MITEAAMLDGRVNPIEPPSDPSRAWLVMQHDHDLKVIDAQADLIADLEATVVGLRREQQVLILQHRREHH